nr:hypothetical protein [Tanacetum cinerariifolium]
SDDNKGVSSEGPSITSIPKDGPSIARRSKDPTLKEFLKVTQNQSDVQNHLVGIQADDHDLLVNSDNENEDMLGYESDKYFDDEDTNGTNHAEDAVGTNYSDLKLVKRGITRLYRVTQSTTFEFLGDLVRKHIGLNILSWKKVDKESRDKLWDEEKSTKGKMARSRNVYHHKMGQGGYVFVKEKMKEADDKIKEGTLNLDDGTDAMIVMFGKENGGYARGVGSGDTYKRYFHLPQSRQATDKRIELLQTQLDNEIRERQQKDVLVKKLSTKMIEKDVLVKKLSNEMTETKGMLSQLMIQLAAQGVQLNLSSQLQVASDASKCKLWHLKKLNIVALGTVCKSDGKQMMYN